MTEAPTPSANAITVGSLLSNSLGIYFSNFLFFTIVAVVASVPGFLFLAAANVAITSVEGVYVVSGAAFVIELIMTGFLNAIFVFAVVMRLRSEPTSIYVLTSQGLKSAGWAIGAVIVTYILISIGTLIFVIPGIIAMCIWFVAVPAAVVERVGPIEAMRISSEMTSGYRWSIFGFFLILILIAVAYGMFIAGFVAVFSAALFGDSILAGVVELLLSTPAYCIPAIAAGYAYVALSTGPGRSSLDQIAAVFD